MLMANEKIMEPQVTLLIKKENKSFLILLSSILWIDAIVIDNDRTDHSWMTL